MGSLCLGLDPNTRIVLADPARTIVLTSDLVKFPDRDVYRLRITFPNATGFGVLKIRTEDQCGWSTIDPSEMDLVRTDTSNELESTYRFKKLLLNQAIHLDYADGRFYIIKTDPRIRGDVIRVAIDAPKDCNIRREKDAFASERLSAHGYRGSPPSQVIIDDIQSVRTEGLPPERSR